MGRQAKCEWPQRRRGGHHGARSSRSAYRWHRSSRIIEAHRYTSYQVTGGVFRCDFTNNDNILSSQSVLTFISSF